MALIAAVIGSFLGILLGVASVVFFGASLLTAFGLYAAMSVGAIIGCSLVLLRKPDGVLAAYRQVEDSLDAEWQDYESQTRALSSDEQAFQDGMETALEDDDRRTGADRRHGDRRSSA